MLHGNPTEERASYDDEDTVSGTFLALFALRPIKSNSMLKEKNGIKDVCAYCYCTSLVRNLFIRHAIGTPCHVIFKRAHRVENSTKYRADDLCVKNVCEYFCWTFGDPQFFPQITSFSNSFHYTKKTKNLYVGSVNYFPYTSVPKW